PFHGVDDFGAAFSPVLDRFYGCGSALCSAVNEQVVARQARGCIVSDQRDYEGGNGDQRNRKGGRMSHGAGFLECLASLIPLAHKGLVAFCSPPPPWLCPLQRITRRATGGIPQRSLVAHSRRGGPARDGAALDPGVRRLLER